MLNNIDSKSLEDAISTIDDHNYSENIKVIENAIRSSRSNPELLVALKDQFSDDDISKKLDEYVATGRPEILDMIKGIVKRSAGLENCSEDGSEGSNSLDSVIDVTKESDEEEPQLETSNMGNIDSKDDVSMETVVAKMEEMTPDKASEALTRIEETHGEDVAKSIQDAVIGTEDEEMPVNECGLDSETLTDVDRIVDEVSESKETPVNFSIASMKRMKKYMTNFATAKLSSGNVSQVSFSKAPATRGSVISRLINMSTEDRAETLAEVESRIGEDTAKELANAAKEERLPKLDDAQVEEVEKIEVENEACHGNFSSKSEANKALVAKWSNFSDTSAPTEDSVKERLIDMTPDEASEALAEIANRTSEDVADKIQADVLAPKSEEFSELSEELDSPTDEDLKKADAAISETKSGLVNCSKSTSAKTRRLHKKYLANFAEVLGEEMEVKKTETPEPEGSEEKVDVVSEKLEELSDHTPEELVALTSDVEEKLGKESADRIEDAVIAKTETGEVPELSEEEKKILVEADPSQMNFSSTNANHNVRLHNFSVRVHRARKRKATNFSDVTETEVIEENQDIVSRLSDCTPEEVTIVSTAIEQKYGDEAACELEDAVIRNCSGQSVTEDDLQMTTDEIDLAKEVDPKSANFAEDPEFKVMQNRRMRNFTSKVEEAHATVGSPHEDEEPSELESTETTSENMANDSEESEEPESTEETPVESESTVEVETESETSVEEPEADPSSELESTPEVTETVEETKVEEVPAEKTPSAPVAPRRKVPGIPEIPEEDEDEHSEKEIEAAIDQQNFSSTNKSAKDAYASKLFQVIGFKG